MECITCGETGIDYAEFIIADCRCYCISCIEVLIDENKQFKKDFFRYSKHDRDCTIGNLPECTCGFDKASERAS